ncbi:unnamed protein product [Heterosigma akashiwo]
MSLLKELPDKGATTAWSPVASHPNLMVLGTKDGGGGFEDYGGELEVHRFDFGEYQEKGSAVLGSFKTPTRFSSIAWSQMSNKSAEYPLGLIAGGMADGVVNVWDPAKLVANHPQPQMSTVHRHQGAVNDLQFNHHPESSHLLATGGADAEVFIMSMDRPDTPNVFVPAPDSNAKHLGEVTKVAWNSQVAHILATAGQNGSCIVWDLRQKKPWCELKDTIRGRIADVAWNPDQGLHIVTASGDDNNPVINLWDLRGNYTVPSATLRGHTQGILSLAWCKKDTSLILSCGKDNRTLMWDLYKGESVYELPATQDGGAAAAAGAPPASVFGTIGGASGRRYELAWSPHVPTLVSACSFDRKVQVFSMGSAANKSGRAPRWMARPAGASFGFGGKLLSFGAPGADGKRKLQVRRVVENLELVAASKRFEDAMASKDFRAYCVQKIEGAQEPYEKKVWQFMQVIFEKNAREQLLTHLGFNPERIAELADKQRQGPPPPPRAPPPRSLGGGAGGAGATYPFSASAPGLQPRGRPSPPGRGREPLPLLHRGGRAKTGRAISSWSSWVSLDGGAAAAAAGCCLKNGQMADALILASCGGAELWASTQARYFEAAGTRRPFLDLMACIIKSELGELVGANALGAWEETLAILSTYAKSDEFPVLCEALAARLEGEARDAAAATLCYMCAVNVPKTGRRLARLRALLSTYSLALTRRLHAMVEKVSLGPEVAAAATHAKSSWSAQGELETALLLRAGGGRGGRGGRGP